MSVVGGLADRKGYNIALPLEGQPLQQALKAPQIAQRLLVGGTAGLAGPHVQLAIDMIEPLAKRQTTCVLLPLDGGKADARAYCKPSAAAGIAS